MKTFKELIDEQLQIEGYEDLEEVHDKLHSLYPEIEKAAIRFANQRTEELQAKILIYREEFCQSHEVGWYDQFFGITNERVGENEG
jgi:hypothetical protein